MKRWSVVAMDTPLVAAAKRVTTLVNAGAFTKATTTDLRMILDALVGVTMPSVWPASANLASGGSMRAKTGRRTTSTARLSVVGSLQAKPLSKGAAVTASLAGGSYRMTGASADVSDDWPSKPMLLVGDYKFAVADKVTK